MWRVVSILHAFAPPQPRLAARLAALAAQHAGAYPAAGQASLHLQAAQLHLRPAGAVDTDKLAAHWNHGTVRRFLFDGRAVPQQLVAGIVAAGRAAALLHRGGLWLLAGAGDEDVVATAALLQLSRETSPELIVTLAPAQWGRGHAMAIGRAVLAHGFDDLNMDAIVADMNLPNPRLGRLAAGLGMRIERRVTRPGLHYYFIDRKMRVAPSRGGASEIVHKMPA